MRYPLIALTLLAMIIAGCASKQWTKAGATQQEFAQDKAECMAMAQGGGSSQIHDAGDSGGFGGGFAQGYNTGQAIQAQQQQEEIFKSCMVGQGWRLTSGN